ncbi:hypothetical protein BST17_01860 [Mycolicibacterium bacteremicum]|uniref:Uncharacterized protein n=1 Tax=Mycolicibacterium bacteremicum TaxID=564198 RepID=A0A1W9Z4L9_MYCBA|nr:hypothetical protein BST17_01860 [Mycolicibacterium bacteremicum]
MKDIASGKVSPEVAFRGDSAEVAMQVDLRRAEPSSVLCTHQANVGLFPSGGIASGAAEAQCPLGYLLIENIVRCREALGRHIRKVQPRLDASGIAPILGLDDAALTQCAVDIGRHAEVPGGVPLDVRVQGLAVI